MEKIIEILSRIKDTVDFPKENKIVTDGIIESIDIVMIISELEETFDIEIGFEYISKENFESAETIWKMVQEIKSV